MVRLNVTADNYFKERKGWYSTVMNRSDMKLFANVRGMMRKTVAAVLTVVIFGSTPQGMMTVEATTITEIQNQIKKDQEKLDSINDRLSNLSDEQDLVEEMIADLNSEILNMLTSIGLKEDEIAAKEADIAVKQSEIEEAQQEYDAAKLREEEQYAAMKIRIRFMYENNSVTVLARMLSSTGISDLINTAQYIEKIYQADSKLLTQYENTKNQVHDLWDQLVRDKEELEADKAQLESDRAHLQSLKSELDVRLEKKKQESANYEAEIRKYQKEAANAKKKIQDEQKQLKKLQEEQKQKEQIQSLINGNYGNTSYTSIIDNASGSDLGKQIAKYACQFIGNPYVYGGTSLTNGADCSGFVYRIYSNFGYKLPRTSYEQRSAGTGVSYDEAQPGDLICYDGHVGMYIGGGKIVHASNEKTGIKVSNATYRTILAVRRIL